MELLKVINFDTDQYHFIEFKVKSVIRLARPSRLYYMHRDDGRGPSELGLTHVDCSASPSVSFELFWESR